MEKIESIKLKLLISPLCFVRDMIVLLKKESLGDKSKMFFLKHQDKNHPNKYRLYKAKVEDGLIVPSDRKVNGRYEPVEFGYNHLLKVKEEDYLRVVPW